MLEKISSFLIAITAMYSTVFASYAAAILPKEALVPGGVAIITLPIKYSNTDSTPPIVYYLGKRTLVMLDPHNHSNWLTVVGIPLNAQLGVNVINIQYNKQNLTKSFVVKSKKYPTQELTIKDPRKVTPLPQDLAIIEAQYLETIDTYATWQYEQISSLSLTLPVRGRKSSPFGLTRILNNIPKDPHSGLDIAAPIGAAVTCPIQGKVINTGSFFYSGNIVFVDHGQGFITSYCHLNSIAVRKGQILKPGDVIGSVGKTGRATGPHLHWSVSLNNVRVDPQLFLNE